MTKRCCVERLAALLDTEDDIEVVGEAGTVADALVRVPALRPAVVVLDVESPRRKRRRPVSGPACRGADRRVSDVDHLQR